MKTLRSLSYANEIIVVNMIGQRALKITLLSIRNNSVKERTHHCLYSVSHFQVKRFALLKPA